MSLRGGGEQIHAAWLGSTTIELAKEREKVRREESSRSAVFNDGQDARRS